MKLIVKQTKTEAVDYGLTILEIDQSDSKTMFLCSRGVEGVV